MGRMRKDAQAVILDALVFLMVVTLVCCSLLSVTNRCEASNDFQEYVERAHHALLRSTVEVGDRSMTLFEATLLVMRSSAESGWNDFIDWINSTLDSLMIPRFNYKWFASSPHFNISIGMRQAPQDEDIYASVFRVDYSEESIMIGLQAWPRI